MAARRKVRFGIIGLGLMGREFGSAIARWCHLLFDGPVPELAGVCDTNPASHAWFTDNFPTIRTATTKHEDLLAAKDIEAVYCAVPHNLHRKLYVDIISAGKHLMGENLRHGQRANARSSRPPQPPGVRARSSEPHYPRRRG
jgi:predicted dehydrogenase